MGRKPIILRVLEQSPWSVSQCYGLNASSLPVLEYCQYINPIQLPYLRILGIQTFRWTSSFKLSSQAVQNSDAADLDYRKLFPFWTDNGFQWTMIEIQPDMSCLITCLTIDAVSYFWHRHRRWQSQILNHESLSNLPMKEKVPLSYRTNFDHLQVAHRFAVQNLTLPSSMLVAKVSEYVYSPKPSYHLRNNF